ncbi:tyrosine-type recombinase/integrase [Geobacter sp. FeAm09]|uniref:tyrosine-type recombinase/integrase n=1 Tax=Geobacter sp. FeAm09 TaxID=2597769 RepID=UPI0011ED95FF|nr:tyrosine-type recombinase/integrase [Geobacter sp. FeAm09]QEM68914.1 tyrosine-type recombinase/integrase [Geobacter sp. FeAm09]
MIQSDHLMLFDNEEKKKGAIIRKKGSSKLYILFYYFNRRVEKTTGVDDTPANSEQVRKWLDRVIEKRDAGKLVFADAFPGASDEEKAYFARLEGWNYSPSPKDIIIGDYIEKWDREVVELYDSHTKRFDYRVILKCWVKPYFAEKTFYELTRLEMQKFIATFKCKIGKNKGMPLSRARASNIVTVVRALFNDATDEYHWDIPDPFRNINRHMPKTPPQVRDIFLFDEWLHIVAALPEWHRPMIEFMMLTGMIHSEISGLLRSHIRADHIMVQQSIVRDIESPTLKTRYRIRKLPITQRIRGILDEVLVRTNSPYVFAQPNGTPYRREPFVERCWRKTVVKCGIPYRPPYSIRHSFAAWSLLVGIEPLRLVKLMGHGSKQMVYEVYGNYLDGLEGDYWEIVNYFGKDYIEAKRKPLSFYQNLLGESLVKERGLLGVTA